LIPYNVAFGPLRGVIGYYNKGDIMAKLTFTPVYRRDKRRHKILLKGFKVRPGETVDIPAKYALTYYGDKNYKVVWDKADKEELLKLEDNKFKRLENEFGEQGSKDIVEKLIPGPKKKAFTKKIIKEAVKPIVQKPAPKKKVEKKEPKKEELKPPIEKKKPAKKAAPKAKKPIKDSEL
tara:strand:- start:174 stop:707 length:534 start_codon:yes stop_codon:yes gene_type:complete